MRYSEKAYHAHMEAIHSWANTVGFEPDGVFVNPRGFNFGYRDMPELRIDLSAVAPDRFMEYTLEKVLEYGRVFGRNELRREYTRLMVAEDIQL